MSREEDSKYSHNVYKNDPVKFKNYVNKRVKIVANDRSVHEGIVYTVDPVSESVILMTPKDSGDFTAEVVIGTSIKSMEIQSDVEESLPDFFPSKNQEVSSTEVQERKEKLIKLFKENRISVDDEDGVLKVLGAVSIEPPYDRENCVCANPIIMKRIHTLMAQSQNVDK